MKNKFNTLLSALIIYAGTVLANGIKIGDLNYLLNSDDYSAEVTYSESEYNSESNYSGLSSITIPASIIYNDETYNVTKIGDNAFRNCSSLTSVTIPSSIVEFSHLCVFYGCNNLISISVDEGNSMYDSRNNCNAIIKTATNTLVAGCRATTIPNDIVTIDQYAFAGLSSISVMDLPESIDTIKTCAFLYCNLSSMYIPRNVTYIELYAFTYSGLNGITVDAANTKYDSRNNSQAIIETETNTLIFGFKNTTIPNDIETIARSAFHGCKGLETVTIPSGVTTIGYEAFRDCPDLHAIVIPDNVTTLERGAFTDCKNLTSVKIGKGLQNIVWAPFSGCDNLTSIVVDADNLTYDSRDNCNAIIHKASNSIVVGCKNTTIPNNVTNIGENAFHDCRTLTSIHIPDNVTSIERWAFDGCTALTAVNIPDGVTSIKFAAFFNCSSLTDITIPNNVTTLEGIAFGDCKNLVSVTCKVPTPPITSDSRGCFYNVNKSIVLYVPYESISLYQSAKDWKEFTNIQAIPGTEPEPDPVTEDVNCNIRYVDKNSALISSEQLTFHVPEAPEFEGFTFLRWEFVGGAMSDGLTIQAVYTANVLTSAPTEVVNPRNAAQKLIREGNVYILRDNATYTATGMKVE